MIITILFSSFTQAHIDWVSGTYICLALQTSPANGRIPCNIEKLEVLLSSFSSAKEYIWTVPVDEEHERTDPSFENEIDWTSACLVPLLNSFRRVGTAASISKTRIMVPWTDAVAIFFPSASIANLDMAVVCAGMVRTLLFLLTTTSPTFSPKNAITTFSGYYSLHITLKDWKKYHIEKEDLNLKNHK